MGCCRLIFSGNPVSEKKFYLLYDSDPGHYNVYANIKPVIAKRSDGENVTPAG